VDGQCTLIELLLKNGADIDDRQGSFAMTPLEVAVANNCQSAAKLLLDNGAAPNGRPGDRQTPLGLAAGMHSTILVNMLLERGAQLNARDGQGKTPLERALERNDEMLADYLKSRGASP
ncbi:MAG: ankyrin repeat domain-containing protein, partial [Candidatus Hydrogenedentes bacterium]|nr:ankyrin repeat domain-containing protein [Candidatus Hydrogenedentota bacterium]